MPKERKPHLHKVKRDIVSLIDSKIRELKRQCIHDEDFMENGEQDIEARRTIAIWIRQRNKLAKQADIVETPLKSKTLQGQLIWED